MTYVLVWLAVTATAVFVAAAAVGSVRNQVTEAPTAMIPTTSTTVALAPEPSPPTTVVESSSTTTSPPAATSTTTTTAAPVTTTTAPSEPAPTTTTTTAPTTTTTAPPASDIRSYDLLGGVVTVEIGTSTVQLAGASPKSGFSMEVEHSGPKNVEVEFKSESHESKFSGEFKDGSFNPEIEESDGDHDDDD